MFYHLLKLARDAPGCAGFWYAVLIRKRYPNIPSPGRVVQGFPLRDMVVNMLSLTALFLAPVGLEPTVGPRY